MLVSLRSLDAPSDHSTPSMHATPFSQETATVPAEVHSDYSWPFLCLSGCSYAPGLYTATAHNVPLRTRIQCFSSSELDEFWWHFRQARNLLFVWLAILYYLVLLAVWYTFISPILEMYKRGANSVTPVVFFTRRIRRAIFLRYVVMVWLLPILEKIRNFALDAFGNGGEGRSHDTGSSQRIIPKPGTEIYQPTSFFLSASLPLCWTIPRLSQSISVSAQGRPPSPFPRSIMSLRAG